VVRQLRGEPPDGPNEIVAASAYGFNISGRLPLRVLNARDQFLFQHNLVTEFLWGDRQDKDGQRGTAAPTQIGSTFRF
jgi:hypothetical protein